MAGLNANVFGHRIKINLTKKRGYTVNPRTAFKKCIAQEMHSAKGKSQSQVRDAFSSAAKKCSK